MEVRLQLRQNCIAPSGYALTIRFITDSKMLKLMSRNIVFGVLR